MTPYAATRAKRHDQRIAALIPINEFARALPFQRIQSFAIEPRANGRDVRIIASRRRTCRMRVYLILKTRCDGALRSKESKAVRR